MGLLSKLFGKDDEPPRRADTGDAQAPPGQAGPSAAEWAAQVTSHYGQRHQAPPESEPHEQAPAEAPEAEPTGDARPEPPLPAEHHPAPDAPAEPWPEPTTPPVDEEPAPRRRASRAAAHEDRTETEVHPELAALLAQLTPASYDSPDGTPVPGMTADLETVTQRLGPPWKVTGPGLVAHWRGPGGELRCGLGHEDGAWHAGHVFVPDAELAAEEEAAAEEAAAQSAAGGSWRASPSGPWTLQPPGTQRPMGAWWPQPHPAPDGETLLAQLTAVVPSLLRSLTVLPGAWGVRRLQLHHELGQIRVNLLLDAADAVEIHWDDGAAPGERGFETPSPAELTDACTAIVEFLGTSGADWSGLRTWCSGDAALTTITAGSESAPA